MHDPAIFNFRPSCLVRMSRDDIIDQYQINPIVLFKLKRKLVKEMMLLYIRQNRILMEDNGEQSRRFIGVILIKKSIY